MKNFRLFGLALFTLVLFIGCEKEPIEEADHNQQYDVYCYYAGVPASTLTLFIDGDSHGELPALSTDPISPEAFSPGSPSPCQDDSVKALCYHTVLPSGHYTFKAKDVDGNTVASSNIHFTASLLETSGGQGGGSAAQSGTCLLVGLWE